MQIDLLLTMTLAFDKASVTLLRPLTYMMNITAYIWWPTGSKSFTKFLFAGSQDTVALYSKTDRHREV